MRPFVAARGGYRAVLEPEEREALAQVCDQVAGMLQAVAPARGAGSDALPAWPTGAAGEEVPAPRDAAVLRLLPSAGQDAAVAREFRRLTQGDLATSKSVRLVGLAALLRVAPEGIPAALMVRREQADAVAGAFTDLRLVLAERLDLRTDAQVEALYRDLDLAAEPDGVDDDDLNRRRFLVAVFIMAGLLQESLVEGMLSDLRARTDRPG